MSENMRESAAERAENSERGQNENTERTEQKTAGQNEKRPMPSNLVSLGDRTAAERAAIGRKGGLKAAENAKRRRTMKEALDIYLSMKASKKAREAAAEIIGPDIAKEISNVDLLSIAAINGAAQGDAKLLTFVRDTVGEMPTTKQEVTATITDGDKALLEKVSKRLECPPTTD